MKLLISRLDIITRIDLFSWSSWNYVVTPNQLIMQTAFQSALPAQASNSGIDFKIVTQGFLLAHFVLKDRARAIEVVKAAIGKLRAQHSRERKRNYWRSKFLKNRVTRIIRTEQDMLQWLICLESTSHEEAQEKSGSLSTRDWVVRYVKALVQATSAMSSFYVSVGLQRLLYDYTTAETQKSYEWLTDLYPNSEAYRVVKASLMGQLQKRFGNKLSVYRGERGEARFESLEGSEQWIGLVQESLYLLTPWSTRQTCLTAGLDGLIQDGNKKREYKGSATDVSEMCWCHAFIEPGCFEDLAQRIDLRSPWERITIPRPSNLGGENGGQIDPGMENVNLRPEEIADIMRKMVEDEPERKFLSPRILLIVADGAHFAEFGIGEAPLTINGEVAEGTRLLEFWIKAGTQNVLWATHWIEYTKWKGAATDEAAVDLGNGRELLIDIAPLHAKKGGQRRISIHISCQPAGSSESTSQAGILSIFRSFAPQYAVALVLVAVAWISTSLIQQRHIGKDKALIQQLNQGIAEQKTANTVLQSKLETEQIQKLLVPDEWRVRGAGSVEENVVHFSSRSELLILSMPVAGEKESSYRVVVTPLLANQAILDESGLSSHNDGNNSVVHLEVPGSLLANGQQYGVDLYVRTVHGPWTKIHTFRFSVVKD